MLAPSGYFLLYISPEILPISRSVKRALIKYLPMKKVGPPPRCRCCKSIPTEPLKIKKNVNYTKQCFETTLYINPIKKNNNDCVFFFYFLSLEFKDFVQVLIETNLCNILVYTRYRLIQFSQELNELAKSLIRVQRRKFKKKKCNF